MTRPQTATGDHAGEVAPGPTGPSADRTAQRVRLSLDARLAELVEIVSLRRATLVTVAVTISILGLLATIALPGLVPPRPAVGALVGVVAVLLGVGAAMAVDSADLVIRGPRHVRAAGATIAAVVPERPEPVLARQLAARVDAGRGAARWLVGVAPASRDVRRFAAWADALAVALAERDRRVITTDLSGRTVGGGPGVLEVVRDGQRLADVVTFDDELTLARVGAGADHRAALHAMAAFEPVLPRDIELVVVALPPLAAPETLAAANAVDVVLIVAESDVTSRVDLIASLDAVAATAATAEVVLLDGHAVPPGPTEASHQTMPPGDERQPGAEAEPDEASEPSPRADDNESGPAQGHHDHRSTADQADGDNDSEPAQEDHDHRSTADQADGDNDSEPATRVGRDASGGDTGAHGESGASPGQDEAEPEPAAAIEPDVRSPGSPGELTTGPGGTGSRAQDSATDSGTWPRAGAAETDTGGDDGDRDAPSRDAEDGDDPTEPLRLTAALEALTGDARRDTALS